MRFGQAVLAQASTEMKPPSLPKSKCFPQVPLHCGCPVPRQALGPAHLVRERGSNSSHAGSLSRSICFSLCRAEQRERSCTLWNSSPGWYMKEAARRAGTVTFFTRLAGWDHGILCCCRGATGCGLRWKSKGNTSLGLSYDPCLLLRAGWRGGHAACCVGLGSRPEGLLRAGVWVATNGSALLRVKIRRSRDDLVPKK